MAHGGVADTLQQKKGGAEAPPFFVKLVSSVT